MNLILDQYILNSINKSIRDTEYLANSKSSFKEINSIFSIQVSKNFEALNFLHKGSLIHSNNINLRHIKQNIKEKNYNKSIIGSSLWGLGRPIIKKRFTTPGATTCTSIASKYLSKVFPQRIPSKILGTTLPKKILGTNTIGRVLGRAVPYIGIGLIVIDVIELLISEVESENETPLPFKNGFGGGGFSGGGAGSSW